MIPYAIVRTPTSKPSNPPLTDSNSSEKTLLIHLSCYYFFSFRIFNLHTYLILFSSLYFSVFSFRRFFPPFHAQKKHTEKDLRWKSEETCDKCHQCFKSATNGTTDHVHHTDDDNDGGNYARQRRADKKKVNKSLFGELSIHKLIFAGPAREKSSRVTRKEKEPEHTGKFLPYLSWHRDSSVVLSEICGTIWINYRSWLRRQNDFVKCSIFLSHGVVFCFFKKKIFRQTTQL